MRYDYLSKQILISSGSHIQAVALDHSINEIQPQIPNFDFVFPIEGIYLAADKKGSLYYSNSIEFEKKTQLPLFLN